MSRRETKKNAEAIIETATDCVAVSWEDFPELNRKTFCRGFLETAYELFEQKEIQEEYQQWLNAKKKSIPAGKQRNAQSLSIRKGRTIQHFYFNTYQNTYTIQKGEGKHEGYCLVFRKKYH